MTFTIHPLSVLIGFALVLLLSFAAHVLTEIKALKDLVGEYRKRTDSLKADLEAERAKNRTTPKP